MAPRRAFRKKPRFTRRRKRVFKRKSRRNYDKPTTLSLRYPDIVPDRMYTKVKYTTQITVSAITTSFWHTFRGNSLYDPDYTGVGGQPLGYDQLSAFYKRVRVHSSKVMLRISNPNTQSYMVSLWPSLDATPTPADDQNWKAQPYSKTRAIGSVLGQGTQYLNNYMSTARRIGIKSIEYSPEYTHDTTHNPDQIWYWHVGVNTTNGEDVQSLPIDVTIHYFVEFYDRVSLQNS